MLCRSSVLPEVTLGPDDGLCTQITVQLEAMHRSPVVVVGSVDARPQVLTLDQVRSAIIKDKQMLMLRELIERGFPDSQHNVVTKLREFHKFRHSLLVVDGIICYKLRVVILQTLRQSVLDTLHSEAT